MNLEELLEKLWNDYIEVTPVALEVEQLLSDRGEVIVNDHLAFRTFAHPKISLSIFEEYFKSFGYSRCGEYNFEQKKLNAIHLENTNDPKLPKLFISELRYKDLGERSVTIIEREIERLNELTLFELLINENIFKVSTSEYKSLIDDSEYAGWLCALGFRANHFTVSVNELKSFKRLEELNELLIKKNISLNQSGGIIKGSASEYLEQTSTMASKANIKFTDKTISIPSCYYEFALRHQLPSGELFQGFVTNSADKIFESTDHELVK